MLRHGLENGDSWVPGEVNTSIRPEWFYHKKEDAKVKKLPQLMDIYHQSIGRNGTLLLNFPIMPNGLIHEYDVQSIQEMTKALKIAFKKNLTKNAKASSSSHRGNESQFDATKTIDGNKNTYWAQEDGITTASLTLQFSKKQTFNRFLVQEYIALGQRVKAFTVEAWVDGKWKVLTTETTIGYKRILRLPTVTSSKIRFSILDSKACPLISNIEVYNAPQILAPPQIMRTRSGDIILKAADPESEIYFTLDGSQPKKGSLKYNVPIQTSNGKVKIKALAYDGQTGKVSDAGEEQFDISKSKWVISNIHDTMAYQMLDGDYNTAWQGSNKSAFEVVIDLNEMIDLLGFKYLPPQHWWEEGNIITEYRIYQSTDGQNWSLIKEGEFSNIKNNPVWQNILFEKPVTANYLKFVSLKTVNIESRPACAEFDVITK
jgi:alpha-L-fucosidase